MRINRRDLLKSAAVLGASIGTPAASKVAHAAERRPFVLVLEGIGPQTSPRALFSFLDPIVSQNIPVGCMIAMSDPSGKPLQESGSLASLLRRLVNDYAGLVELIAHVPQLASQPSYFQMRSSSDAQSILASALSSGVDADHRQFKSLTIATTQPRDAVGPIDGARVAGFRTVLLVPEETRPVDFWETDNGILQLNGGRRLPSLSDAEAAIKAIRTAGETEEPVVAYISMSQLAGLSKDAIFSLAASFGDALNREVRAGYLYGTLPAEFHLRYAVNYTRRLALRLDVASGGSIRDGAASPEIEAFVAALKAAGISFSLFDSDRPSSEAPAAPGTEDDFEVCARADEMLARWRGTAGKPSPAEGEAARDERPTLAACAVMQADDAGALDQLAMAGAVLVTAAGDEPTGFIGLDRHGLLHLPTGLRFDGSRPVRNEAEAIDDIERQIGYQQDALIAITAEALATAEARGAIVSALKRLGNGGDAIRNLNQFRQDVVVADDMFGKLTSAAMAKAADARQAGELDTAQKADILRDAELAWQYFEELTDKDTKLVPSTAWFDNNQLVDYRECTMWDAGSLIQGTVSAHMIGLIDDREFSERVEGLLPNLATARIGDLRLPADILPVDKGGRAGNGFNAYDTGRLLVALGLLSKYGNLQKEIARLLSQWDLAEIVIDGHLHSIRNGRKIDIFRSNYTHYAARGFGLWDIEADSPFERPDGEMDMDGKMRLMDRAARIGQIGTEPHVLEEMELGYSPAGEAIADMLFSAQLDEHRRTGKFVCVSEGPLDREPWFTYQGYQIGAEDDPWKITTLSSLERYKTPGFSRAVRMISTKGAFLWAAARPNDYTRALLEHVRKKTKVAKLGFASGIYSATGLTTRNYSDVNTNGIILEAVAYMLRGRKSLASTKG